MAGGERAVRFVGDDVPGCAREAFVQNFGYDADVGVGVGRGHHARVDVGYPEFAEGGVEGGEGEGRGVEEETACVSGAAPGFGGFGVGFVVDVVAVMGFCS